MKVLGIETSCDETGVAIFDTEKNTIVSAQLYSQAAKHALYGGVVPELASRDHLKKLIPLIRLTVQESGYLLSEIDGIAYTAGPGLRGPLLIGASAAKAIALSLGKPSIGIHHMEAHLLINLLDSLSKDPLKFVDNKPYTKRSKEAEKNTGLKDAVRIAVGKSLGEELVVACMDFRYIGGSMGSVVGEKISRAVDHAISNKTPLLIISKSGGARMMEGAISLMQMAKTSAKLTQLSKNQLPYISLCTDPTTGGTTASFAMLGDIIISEPGALIGFAGPRVVKDTTGQDLPEGFQRSEFLLDNGFIDFISHRNQLKKNINLYIDLILNAPLRNYS